MGVFGVGDIYTNGKKLIDFSTFNNLRIMNTFFRHKMGSQIHMVQQRKCDSNQLHNSSSNNHKSAEMWGLTVDTMSDSTTTSWREYSTLEGQKKKNANKRND